MLVNGSVPLPPPWTTVIRWQDADMLVDRYRFVLRVAPALAASESIVNEILGIVASVSPVRIALRFIDGMGSIVFDILEDFDVGFLLTLLDAAITSVLPDDAVRYLEPDPVHAAMAGPNDEFASDWPYARISAAEAWAVEPGANPQVMIGVIDTGIVLNGAGQVSHPDFDPSRFDLGTNFVSPHTQPRDDNSHGTLVTGIAVASRNNSEGIPGMTSGTRAHICKTLRGDLHGNTSDFKRAVVEIVDNAVASGRKVVINYSAGGREGLQELRSACQYVQSHGMLLCAASGTSDGVLKYPAAFASTIPNIIAVGGIDQSDGLFGPASAEVFAPAVSVRSAKPQGFGSNDFYTTVLGTSIATPFVTGLAALIWSHQPTLTAPQVKQRILESARLSAGRRILDAAAALKAEGD